MNHPFNQILKMKTKVYNEQKKLVASPAEPCLIWLCGTGESNKVNQPPPAFHPSARPRVWSAGLRREWVTSGDITLFVSIMSVCWRNDDRIIVFTYFRKVERKSGNWLRFKITSKCGNNNNSPPRQIMITFIPTFRRLFTTCICLCYELWTRKI